MAMGLAHVLCELCFVVVGFWRVMGSFGCRIRSRILRGPGRQSDILSTLRNFGKIFCLNKLYILDSSSLVFWDSY